MKRNAQNHNAFGMVELAIALLIGGLFMLAIHRVVTATNLSSRGAKESQTRINQLSAAKESLKADLQRLPRIHPRCAGNVTDGATVLQACGLVPIRGALIPFFEMASSDSRLNLIAPTSFQDRSPDSTRSDAIRLIQVVPTNAAAVGCRLDPTSFTGGNGLIVNFNQPGCGILQNQTQKLFVIAEAFGQGSLASVYGNFFDRTGIVGQQVQVEPSSPLNQANGLAASGFTNFARVYPVRFVDIAQDPHSRRLVRREWAISTGANQTELMPGPWVTVAQDVDRFLVTPQRRDLSTGQLVDFLWSDATSLASSVGLEDIESVRLFIQSGSGTPGESILREEFFMNLDENRN